MRFRTLPLAKAGPSSVCGGYDVTEAIGPIGCLPKIPGMLRVSVLSEMTAKGEKITPRNIWQLGFSAPPRAPIPGRILTVLCYCVQREAVMADFDFEDDPTLGVSETSNGGADGQASSSYLPAGEEDIQDYVSNTHKGRGVLGRLQVGEPEVVP